MGVFLLYATFCNMGRSYVPKHGLRRSTRKVLTHWPIAVMMIVGQPLHIPFQLRVSPVHLMRLLVRVIRDC